MAQDILTPERILDAAEETLRRFGPRKTTVVDVARALDVSHGSVYRHFAAKTALREAVTERWLKRVSLPLLSIAWQQQSATERLKRWLDTLISLTRNAAESDPEMFASYTALAMDGSQMAEDYAGGLIEQLSVIIREGLAEGEFKSAFQAEHLARSIFHATSRFHHPAHRAEWKREEVEGEYRQVWQLLLNGLLASK